jgi:hypothetical protein
MSKVQSISQQIDSTENRLAGGQEKIQDELRTQKDAILDRVDEQHRQTLASILTKMDADQLEVTELLYDAADKQQLAEWEIGQLNLLTQQAVVDLKQLQTGQPDADQWADVLTALEGATSLAHKLHLSIPLIPLILNYETELAVDVIPALKQTWQTAVSKIRNLRAR